MTAESRADNLLAGLGEVVEDAAEETFILFSQELPPNDLGMVDGKVDEIDFEINGRSISIYQSSSLLVSNRVAGTTGAMVWKVTPRIAQWLASEGCILRTVGILDSSKNVVELGCGISGLIGITISPLVQSYILTDQNYVLKYLKENILRNAEQKVHGHGSNRKSVGVSQSRPRNLQVVAIDWEHDSVQNLRAVLPHPATIDFVIVCDCVFNDYLIEPLTETCVDICNTNPSRNTIIMVAQQLRADDVFEKWLTRFARDFVVYRIRDDSLPLNLQSSSGYVVHLGLLRTLLRAD